MCVVLHPDPPLRPDEKDAMDALFRLAGLDGTVDIVTPRTFAQRGGRTAPCRDRPKLVPTDALAGVTVALPCPTRPTWHVSGSTPSMPSTP